MKRLAATLLALAPLLAMPGAQATARVCVGVVVDYGTAAGAPHGPNGHCIWVDQGAIAAEVLAARAATLHTAPPRYHGNFLCGIDGYPESGCGDESPNPYWEFWLYRGGGWQYSELGVDTYAVEDRDHDGHPDVLGFRFQPLDAKQPPRANGAYTAVCPQAAPPAPAPSPARTTSAPTTPAATPTRTRPSGSRTVAPQPIRTAPAPEAVVPATAVPMPTTPEAVEPARAARSRSASAVPTAVAVAVVVALLVAAGLRARRT